MIKNHIIPAYTKIFERKRMVDIMFNIERQREILNILEKYGSVSVNKLSNTLYVSPPTIRRDLTMLENQGKICRTHG